MLTVELYSMMKVVGFIFEPLYPVLKLLPSLEKAERMLR
jgi:hypothetical protein